MVHEYEYGILQHIPQNNQICNLECCPDTNGY